MKKNKPKTLIHTIKSSSLITVIMTALLITITTGYVDLQSFNKRSKNIESEYLKEKKSLLKDQIYHVTDYIAEVRTKTKKKIKQRIKQRTYDAHAIATNIYNKFGTNNVFEMVSLFKKDELPWNLTKYCFSSSFGGCSENFFLLFFEENLLN